MMHFLSPIFTGTLFLISTVHADVIRTDVEPNLSIAAGETKNIVMESEYGKPIETFWQTLSPEECTTSACIKFQEKGSSFDYDSFNGQGTHEPIDKKVTLSFTNQSKTPVTIKLTRIEKTCTAEVCRLILIPDTQDWKVVRIQKLKALQTSEDGSYSTLQGVTTKGKEFDITLAWWFYKPSSFMNCPKYIKSWIDKPKPEYAPYVIAGSTLVPNVKNKNRFILSVDTCTKKAGNFNAPKESEY
jgi:hypothetical protein